MEHFKIKHLANLVTTVRIFGAFLLLSIKPLSITFFVIYALCGVSDMLDGHVARKTKTTSRFGEALDSTADLIFIVILLIVFIPLFSWKPWMLYWMGTVALTRFVSLWIGFVKYRTLPSLHTYSNKATGIALFCFPLLYRIAGLPATALVLCGIASISAFEELIITIRSKSLDRNVVSIFYNKQSFINSIILI